jgi:hypothetical protein
MCCDVDVCAAADVKAQRPSLGKGLVAGSVALPARGQHGSRLQQQVKNGLCCDLDVPVAVATDAEAQRVRYGEDMSPTSVALPASGQHVAAAN